MYRPDGSLAYDSSILDEPFQFVVDATPSDVIPGWDICIKHMNINEISSFTIPSSLAFGTHGLPEPISIPPNTDIICYIHLLSITPPIYKRYKSVGYNESIKEELAEKVQNNQQSYISPNSNSNSSNKDKQKGVIYYDESKGHKLDPNQVITGTSIV